MHRSFFLLAGAVLATAAAVPAPAQQPKAKLAPLQAISEQKLELKRHVFVCGFSPDGKQLAVGDENVHLFDVTGESAREVAEFKSRVGFGLRSLTYSRDGRYVIFGGADNSVRVWDVAAKAETANVKSHRGDVMALATSPDGKTIASGSNDTTTILWSLGADGKLVEQTVLKCEDKTPACIRSVAFGKGPKGAPVVVTAGNNGTFRVYPLGAAQPRQAGVMSAKKNIAEANLTPNPAGTVWALSDHENIILLSSSGNSLGAFGGPKNGHQESISDLSFSPDGKLLASVGRDGTLFVWDAATKAATPKYAKHRPGRFSCVAFSPYQDPVNGDVTLAAGLEDGNVHVIKLGYR